MPLKLVILDRDGVINKDSPAYIKTPREWKPIEGSLEAISILTDKGIPVHVATNQSGIGRGHYTESTLRAIHNRMISMVEHAGGKIASINYCPHLPDEGCPCRKPKPGMLLDIAGHSGVSIADCVFVGDSQTDLDAAQAAGCVPILVETGNGKKTRAHLDQQIPCYKNLLAFVRSANISLKTMR